MEKKEKKKEKWVCTNALQEENSLRKVDLRAWFYLKRRWQKHTAEVLGI